MKTRLIKLSKGYFATVDAEDYPTLMQGGKWHAQVHRFKDGTVRNVYACRKTNRIFNGTKEPSQLMHRVILKVTDRSTQVDHKDHWGLNNTRKNLRKCTQSQNMMNQRLSLANTSGITGVRWHQRTGKWEAHIKVHGKFISLGYFTAKASAQRARNAAALQHFGEFALISPSTKKKPVQSAQSRTQGRKQAV